MLSALTDTGKTGTVLRLLREHGGRFLSDDMTIIDAGRHRRVLPEAADDQPAHPAGGRTPTTSRRGSGAGCSCRAGCTPRAAARSALALSRFNLPIMGINAITQILVPPPKYSVDRLVPCQIGQLDPGRGPVHHRARRAPAGRPRPRRHAATDAHEHRRRLRLPAVPLPRAGRHHRRPRLPRAARARGARSCAPSSRTCAPGCSPPTRSAGPTRSRACSARSAVAPGRGPATRVGGTSRAASGPRW